MSIAIVVSVALGIAAGYFFIPESISPYMSKIIVAGLSFILFSVGIDLGFERNLLNKVKKLGLRLLLFPAFAIIGTLAGSAFLSMFTSISLKESLVIGGGLGWSTLAPVLVMDYSVKLSALVFLSNIIREVIGILLVPFVANRIGYIEAAALPGASSMDLSLPVIERSCSVQGAIYGILIGAVMTLVAPIIIPIFLAL